MSEFEGDGASGEPAVVTQPQPMGTSTNPFVMAPPPANENTTLNFQEKTTYTPGKLKFFCFLINELSGTAKLRVDASLFNVIFGIFKIKDEVISNCCKKAKVRISKLKVI